MTTFCDVVQQRSGATPATYDGGGSVTLSPTARHVLALIASYSRSAQTAEEGDQPIIKLSSDSLASLPTPAYILVGNPTASGPATNASVYPIPYEVLALDFKANGGEQINLDISTTGGTQTGTYDQTHGIMYSDVMPPKNWQDKFPNILAIKGGVSNWQACAVTTETKLATHGGSSDNRIPGWAKAIVGIKANLSKDGAVTAAEEQIGYVRLEGAGVVLGTSKWPTNGLAPGLGTEVDVSQPVLMPYVPCHIPLPGRDVVITMLINLYGAVTNNVQAACSLVYH